MRTSRIIITIMTVALVATGASAGAGPATAAATAAATEVRSPWPGAATTARTARQLKQISKLPRGWSVDREGRLAWRSPSPIELGHVRPEIHADGALLGFGLISRDGRTVTLSRPGVLPTDPDSLQVVAGNRRLDVAQPDQKARATHVPPIPRGVTPNPDLGASARTVLPAEADPGRPGPYRTRTAEYSLAAIHLTGLTADVETQAVVVAPVGARGRRLVAVFLHGHHPSCYRQDEIDYGWPCTSGWLPIPSYRGFLQTQRQLASQGWLTVSISADGINGQDEVLDDGGAAARAALIEHHLTLWAGWSAADRAWAKAPAAVRSGPRPDLLRVLFVGHSRGGEGVAYASLDSASGVVPWHVAGQVLLGPTNFNHRSVPRVPTEVILPYCDGDVVDLVGQGYVDDSRDVTADRSLRSAVLVMGANHNCFNSEWTPGSSVAPSWDDWARPQDPTCGTSAPLRLSAAQQRVVGATYVAAAARAFVDRDARVVPLLDGSPVRAASAGPAVVLSHALGGRRTVALVPSGPGGVKGTGAVSAVACGTEASVDPALISCGGEFDATPHFPMDYFVGSAPPPTRYVDHVSWSSARGSAQALLPRPASLAGAGSMDLRVIVAPRAPATRFAVRVRDAAGRSAVLGEATLTGLPGAADSSTGDAPGKWWAQAVRLPLRSAAVTASGVDLRHITRIDLLPRSATGEVWVLDAWARHPGLARAENVPVVRVDLGHWRVQEGGDGRRTVRVPVTLTGTIDVPATFWIVQAARKADLPPALAAQYVTIAPGTRRLEVGLQVVGNALDDEDLISRPVYAQAVSDTVVGDWAGALDILDDDPSPSVTITSAHAVEGESLVWALSLSAPSHREVSVDFRAIPVPSGTAALATDDVPDWWLAPWTGLPSSPPVPLADLDLSLFCNVPAGQTGSTLEIPTVADDRAEGEEQVVLDVVGEVPGLPAGTQVTGTVVDAA